MARVAIILVACWVCSATALVLGGGGRSLEAKANSDQEDVGVLTAAGVTKPHADWCWDPEGDGSQWCRHYHHSMYVNVAYLWAPDGKTIQSQPRCYVQSWSTHDYSFFDCSWTANNHPR